ncbi:MAG: pyridoxal phosphate-dependent aminotransferase [Halobacteriales archaeon]
MLAPLEYLRWYRNRSGVDHDLGGTDLRTDPPDRSRIVPEALSGVGDPPDDQGAVSLLAAEYGVDPGNVVLASGARHAHLLAVMAALGGAGGEPAALVEAPAFEPLFKTPAGLGARVDRFARPAPAFELDPARIEAALTPETASVTVTNRHNPSGYRSEEGELAAVAEAAADRGALLISNEVYAPYGSERDEVEGPFGGPTAAGLPNAIAVGSLTKFHGLGELRVGWLVVPDDLRERVAGIEMHFPTVGVPNRLLAARALSADHLVERARGLVRSNHRLLAEFVADRPDLSATIHDGASFGFVAHERASGDEVARAAGEEGLIVIPGGFFGESGRFRMGLGRDSGETEAALERFGSVLDRL